MPVQPADPRARKIAIVVTIAVGVVGAGLIFLYQRYEEAALTWLSQNLHLLAANPIPVLAAGFVFVAPLLFAAAYLFRYGSRAVTASRLPPPGYAVARDTPVREGSSARAVGRLIQSMSALIFVLTFVIPVFLWYILRSLAGPV